MTSNDKDTLYLALQTGNLELFQYIIQKGSNVFHVAEDKTNCLHIATKNGHLGLSKILLETHNLDIHLADDKGLTALHHAAAISKGMVNITGQLMTSWHDSFTGHLTG